MHDDEFTGYVMPAYFHEGSTKEGNMDNLANLKARRDRMDRLAAGLDIEIQRQEAIASIPEPSGNVVKITRVLNGTGYKYVAIRVRGTWYTTGMTRNMAYTWKDLMAFVHTDASEVKISEPTGWKKTLVSRP